MGTKYLVRDTEFHLNTGTPDSPVWVEINGLTDFTPSNSKTDADTTTFDEDGEESHLPASRGASFTLGGKIIYTDETLTTRDPGQLAVETWAKGIGPAGLKQFRMTLPDAAGTTKTFLASCSITPNGGGTNDAAGWNLAITRSGPTIDSNVGAAPSTPGTPTGSAGDDLVTVSWTGSAGTGGHFVVYAYDDGVLAHTRITSTSPYTFNGLANTTGYTFRVRAVSATGQESALSAESTEYTTT